MFLCKKDIIEYMDENHRIFMEQWIVNIKKLPNNNRNIEGIFGIE